MKIIPNTFITHSSDTLGDTNDGLSGNNIVRAFTGYAIDYNIEIPYSNYPFDVNKRTSLLENLRCFKPDQQYKIRV